MTLADIMNIDFPVEFGADEDNMETGAIERVYDQLDETTETAYGASKFVIFLNEKEVVKVPFNGAWQFSWNDDIDDYEDDMVFDYYRCTDYCAVEAAIYKKAVKAGVEMFFASTKSVGTTFTHKAIYVSERVNDWYSDKKISPSNDSIEKAKKICCYLPIDWIALAYEKYDDELVNRLLDFIDDENINDLHTGNLGIRADGSPCILDYSGFNW